MDITILNELYRVAFRRKLYETLDELQADLDEWMREYNEDPVYLSLVPEPVFAARRTTIDFDEQAGEMLVLANRGKRIVLGVPKERLHHFLEQTMLRSQTTRDSDLSVDQLKTLVARYQEIIFGESRQTVPDDAEEQLRMAIAAVFDSWMTRRAIDYRRLNRLPDDVGTAVNVQSMVFGNVSANSGTGVAFTRDPSTGEPTFFGEFLDNAQGEDVVAGRMSLKLPKIKVWAKKRQRRLTLVCSRRMVLIIVTGKLTAAGVRLRVVE